MLAGFPQIIGAGKKSYADAVAAITNKTVYARADTATGLDGNALNTNNWDNESIATPNISGTATWKTNALGGSRGVLLDASLEAVITGLSTAQVVGDAQYTAFFVEMRTGTQGTQTGNSRTANGVVLRDGGDYMNMCFEPTSRQFCYESFDTTYKFTPTGVSFTDGVPYVLAWKIDAAGNMRLNFSGAITNLAAASVTTLGSTVSGNFQINRRANSGSSVNYLFECIISSDEISDADMDNLVAALQTKWGIS